MRGVDEHVRVLARGEMFGQVPRVQDHGELGAAVLRVGAEVTVQFFERGELRVRRRGLVRVGGLVDDPDGRRWRGGFFEQGEEMRG